MLSSFGTCIFCFFQFLLSSDEVLRNLSWLLLFRGPRVPTLAVSFKCFRVLTLAVSCSRFLGSFHDCFLERFLGPSPDCFFFLSLDYLPSFPTLPRRHPSSCGCCCCLRGEFTGVRDLSRYSPLLGELRSPLPQDQKQNQLWNPLIAADPRRCFDPFGGELLFALAPPHFRLLFPSLPDVCIGVTGA